MYYSRRTRYYLSSDVRRLGGYPLWLCFRCLPALVLAMLILLLLTTSVARAQEAASVGPNGVEAGQLLLHNTATGRYTPAVLQDSKVHFDISGMMASVVLDQTFHNHSDSWMEAVYAFPLPDQAAVTGVEMLIGERRIVGMIKEKSLARKVYLEAKKAGKKTSLVEQQRPNLFSNRVANIGPGEEIRVRLRYMQQVNFNRGVFSLRFPMTITPRYIPGAPLHALQDEELHSSDEVNPYLGWALATDQVPDADAITPYMMPGDVERPINPIEVTASLDIGMPLADVTAPYHELAMSRSKNRYEIRLARGFSEMDRDFVLSWQAVTGSVPRAAVFTEEVGGEHFALLMVVPPALSAGAGDGNERLPREVIFVIDTSGSMGGVAIAQARESLSLALRQLQSTDFFNVIEFNSSHRALYKKPLAASRHNVERALEYVRQLAAGGGTEMLPALRAALSSSRGIVEHDDKTLRQVVFITDGAVGNEQALFKEISTHLSGKRLFTVGIGSAPNAWFMRKAAQFGRGTHVHIGDLGEVNDKMAALFNAIASPVARDISVAWPVGVESYPERIPDLYRGEPLMVAAKSTVGPLVGDIRVSGTMAGQVWSRALTVMPGPGSALNHAGVSSIWARQKIAALLDLKATGSPEEDVRPAVLSVALAHNLLSPYTSFVAVEETVSRPLAESLGKSSVSNAQPAGQSPQPFAYPRTATTAPANIFLGSLLLFVALIVFVARREEVDHVPATAA